MSLADVTVPRPAAVGVLGASGYVGGRLIDALVEGGHRVRAFSRRPAKLDGYHWRDSVEATGADVLDLDSLQSAFEGLDVVYHLVHSMEAPDFTERDRTGAANVARAAERAGVRRIIYLGGLGSTDLSPHLASRQEVGRVLASGAVPVTELRAAVVIGSGSLSFEMLRYLTEVLPAMVTPRWVRTRCQPIAISDVLSLLVSVLDHPDTAGRILDIGGADVLTYQEMMEAYADEAGLRRRLVVPVPVLSPSLSSRWVGLVTPISSGAARHLVDSLGTEVVVDPAKDIRRFVDHEPLGFREAIRRAIDRTRRLEVPTRWSPASWQPADPLPSDPGYSGGSIRTDRRQVTTAAPPGQVWGSVLRIGGDVGYYSASWAWTVRGWLDQLAGGAGLRRGRRHPSELRVGEALDFWRVAGIEPGRALQLKAEMRLPGEAWLELRVEPAGEGTRLTQTAIFAPRGVWGRAYWLALLPFHAVIFPRMAKGLVGDAEARWRSEAESVHEGSSDDR